MSTQGHSRVFDYRTLRLLIGVIAMIMPWMVWFLTTDPHLQSISASYYYDRSRNIFVGFLFIVGAFLLAYKGHTIRQGRLSVCAAFAAFCIALFPTSCDGCDVSYVSVIHYLAAGILFSILSAFCFVFFRTDIKRTEGINTCKGVPQTSKQKLRSGIYLVCGWVMVLSIITMLVFLIPALKHLKFILQVTFWGELIALSAFGIAWFTAGKLWFLADKDEALLLRGGDGQDSSGVSGGISLLLRKEPPFLLVLIFAAISWSTTHLVSRTIEQPVIEYTRSIQTTLSKDMIPCTDIQETMDNTKKSEVVFRITNISKDMLFENFNILIRQDKGRFYGVRTLAIHPAVAGNKQERCAAGFAYFEDLTMQPGWAFELHVVTDERGNPEIYLDSSKKPLNLTKANFQTALARNETEIILLILFSSIVLLIIIVLARPQE